MRLRIAAVLGFGAALVAAPLVLAQVQDRVTIRGLEGNPTDHYSPALSVVAVSPPEYKRGCCYDHNGGELIGPRYQATERATLGGDATIDWSVGVAVRVRSTRAALVGNLTHDWPVVSEGKQAVKHRVGGRAAGTIGGYWILTRQPFGGEDAAAFEAAVGFPLCDGNTGYAKFSLLLPSGNSAGGSIGFGDYVIEGMRPSDWNAAKAMQSIRGIRLEGNRPTTRVSARRQGPAVAGAVTDCNRHPVAQQAVVLERRSGSRWVRVTAGKTSARGAYSLRARGAGTYRVVAANRRSTLVRVG
jgi:hypothetical protein